VPFYLPCSSTLAAFTVGLEHRNEPLVGESETGDYAMRTQTAVGNTIGRHAGAVGRKAVAAG
jgi:hypothetical protein